MSRNTGLDRAWLTRAAARWPASAQEVSSSSLYSPLRIATTPADEEVAAELLENEAQQRGQRLSKTKRIALLQTKNKACVATVDDYMTVITHLAEGSGSAVVLDILLQQFCDAQLKPSKLKPLQSRSYVSLDTKKDFIGTLLAKARTLRRLDLLEVLSRRSDGMSIQSLFQAAMSTKDLACARIALLAKANPNKEPSLWFDAVKQGSLESVQLLLSAPIPISDTSRSAALVYGVERSNPSILKLLLNSGADANYDGAQAFASATMAFRRDLMVMMLLGSKPPNPDMLDTVVTKVLDNQSQATQCKDLFKILIVGGAKGVGVARLLTRAVAEDLQSLCRSLVGKGASIQYNEGEAFKLAIQSRNLEIVKILDESSLGSRLASQIFAELPNESPRQLSSAELDLVKILLKQGATGEGLDKALLQRARFLDVNAVKELLQYGASVNHDNAAALQAVVSHGDIELVKLLIDHRPRAWSLASAFRLIRNDNRETRLAMTRMFLESNVRGPPVHDALRAAVLEKAPSKDLELIQLLASSGADCDQNNGALIQDMTRIQDFSTLGILVSESKKPRVLGAAVAVAMQIPNPTSWLKALEMLVQAGAEGPQISKALIDCVDGTAEGLQATNILIASDSADLSFDSSQAMVQATLLESSSFFNVLLSKGLPSSETIDRSFEVGLALHGSHASRKEKLLALISRGVTAQLRSEAIYPELRTILDTGISSTVLSTLIEYGADVNHDDGKALSLAVSSNRASLIKLMLSARPSKTTLHISFKNTYTDTHRTVDLKTTELLLEAQVSKDERSEALSQAISWSPPDKDFIEQLISYRVSVNYRQGIAILMAIDLSATEPWLLAKLLALKPNKDILEIAWAYATQIAEPEMQYPIYKQLLEAGMKGDTISQALVVSVHDNRQELARLLLVHSGSVDYAEGAAMCLAIKTGNMSILNMLLEHQPLSQTIAHCLDDVNAAPRHLRIDIVRALTDKHQPDSAMNRLLLSVIEETTEDVAIVELLLKRGASVHHKDYKGIFTAARNNDAAILKALLGSVKGTGLGAIASRTFSKCFAEGNYGQSQAACATMCLLLEAGAKGTALGEAFLRSVGVAASNQHCRTFVGDLLKTNRDLDNSYFQSLVAVIDRFDLEMLTQLLSHITAGQTAEVVPKAFLYIFLPDKHKTEDEMLKLTETFRPFLSQHDFNFIHSSFDSPLTLTLKHYATYSSLIEVLVTVGANVNEKDVMDIGYGSETVSLLCWAIYQSWISDELLCRLIDYGADVEFKSRTSATSLLILAVTHSREQCVRKLLDEKVEIGWTNHNGGTALLYASRTGNKAIVSLLLEAGATIDDQSFYEAMMDLQIDVVRLFLEHGYNVDTVVSEQHCRTLLAELCLNVGSKFSKTEIQRMIELLAVTHGATITRKFRGKSLLLLALDNQHPVRITQALCDAFMKKFVNEEFNRFYSEGIRYSPIEYVRQGKNLAPASTRDNLILILEGAFCDAVFYSETSPQPKNYVVASAPPEIVAEERRYQARQKIIREEREDHERKLEYQRKEADQAKALAEREANTEISLANKIAQARNADTKAAAELAMSLDRQKIMLRHKDEEHTRRAALDHKRSLYQLDINNEKMKHKLQTEQENQRSIQQRAIHDAEFQSRQKFLTMENSQLQSRNREARTLLEFETEQYARRGRMQQITVAEQRKLIEAQEKLGRTQERLQGAGGQRMITGSDLD